jgi:hypothetical protein
MGLLRPLLKLYHRSEVRGLENFPPGGALVVANHSGGLFPMDVPVFALGFYDTFGYDRPGRCASRRVRDRGCAPTWSPGSWTSSATSSSTTTTPPRRA